MKSLARRQEVAWGPVAALLVGFGAYIGSQISVGVLIAIAAGIFGFSYESIWAEDASSYLTLLLSLMLAGSMLGILWLYVKGRGGLRALGLVNIPAKEYWIVIPALGFYILTLLATLILIEQLLPGINLDQEQDVGFKSAQSVFELIAAGLALVVIAPVSEEILFRGFVFRGLNRKFSWPIAAAVSSGLFGLAHWQLNVGIDTFVLGMVACWLTFRTNSVLPAILLHGIKNAVAFTTVFILGL